MARAFAYADAHRYRIGPNYRQLPVNQPVYPVNTYAHQGHMEYQFNPADAPVYTPNRFNKGAGYLDDGVSSSSGVTYGQASELFVNPDPHGTDLVRAAYVQHEEDGDFVQAGILYREVMDEGEKQRLAHNITNAMVGVSEETEQRCYWYWEQVDAELGAKVRELFAKKK